MKKVCLTLFQSLFSTSLKFSSHQNNDNANEYFHMIQRFIRQRSFEFQQLLNDAHRVRALNDKIIALKKIAVSFFAEYGALIVVSREEQFSPIDISIVFVTQWGLTTYIKKETVLYLPDKPLSTENIYVGRAKFYDDIQFFCQDLAKEMRKIMKEQQQYREKKYKNNDRKNHHTPSYLLQIAKNSLSNINDQHLETMKKRSQQGQKIEVKQIQIKEVLSKGGTLDVGIHTGITSPNTTLQLVLACFQYLLQSKDLVEIIHLYLKLYQLREKIIDFRQFQYSNFLNLQKCLKELCRFFKELSLKQLAFNHVYIKNEIKIMSQRLQSVFRPHKMNEIEPQQLCNHLQTLKYKNQLTFNEIEKYDIDNEFILVKNGNLGISRSFTNINSFRKLLECRNHYTIGIWIITVENFFFQKAINCLAPGKRLTVPLEEVRCNSETQLSVIHKIIIEYECAIKGKDQAREYGMKLANQAFSHYYLIRYIGAAIVFQTVKQSRKAKKSNLNDYRIPSSIELLSQYFTSLSSMARKALKVMVQYEDINSRKEPIFILGESHKSIMKFVDKIAIEQNSIKNWIDQKQKRMNNQMTSITADLQNFKEKYSNTIKNLQAYQQSECNCLWQIRIVKKKQKSVKIQCKFCQVKSNYQKSILHYEKQTKNYIIAPFPRHEKSLYGFLNNIPLDILGLMKVIYQAQIYPGENIKDNPKQKNFFSKNYSQFFIWSEDIKKSTFLCYLNYDKYYEDLVKYPPNDVYFYYRGNKTAVPIAVELLSPQVYEGNIFSTSHQFMINNSPISNKNREHEIYSKLNLTHKKSNESLQDFINYGSLRVTSITQIPLLCQMVRQRTIRLNFLIESNLLKKQEDKHLFVKALIVLNTVGHVQSFDIPDENVRHEYLMNSCITDLLKKYLEKWKYDDLYCLHLTGAIFSILSKLINKNDHLLPILYKVFEQYEKLASQVKTHDNTSKSQLAFFLHGAMSFYCQDITYLLNSELVHLWTKIHFLYRIKKVFSDQNIADQRYRETLIFFQHFRERAICNNIENVSNYFKKRPLELLAIIKKIDADINDQTIFIHSPQKGDYIYTGASAKDKIYEINLFTGVLLKNGVELAGLPDVVKKNPRYVSIFGQNRDLQVYPEIDGSLRTRNNFDIYFKNEKNAIILFQFKIMKKDVIIRMIIKRNITQIKYVLIPDVQLDKSNFEIPILYRDKYFAWYCSEEKVLVFREKQIDHIKNISLVMLLDKKQLGKSKKVILNSARIVENNFKLEPVQYVKNIENEQLFNLLKFKTKNQKFQQIYACKILSSLQDPRYILQISSPSRTSKDKKGPRLIKFVLHRYNLTFTLVDNKYLYSDNYQGYAVSPNYDDHKYLPWSQIDKVKCLVLEKIDKDLRFSRNNQFMVLIPDNKVCFEGPKNPISQSLMNIESDGQNLQMKELFSIFSYEIHDHFHDLRGKNRLQTLHLAALVAACWKTNKQSIMTNQQYAISLLRSCYSTKPLSHQEFKKLQNVFKNAIQLNQHTLILVCQVVYFLSSILENILPIGVIKDKSKKQDSELKIENLFSKHQQLIGHCKYHYQSQILHQNNSIRSELSQLEKKILGIKIAHPNKMRNKQRGQRQAKSNLSLITSKKIQDDFQSWHEILLKVYQLKKQLTGAKPQASTKNIPLELNLEVNCQMSIEQQSEIKSSIASFHRNNQKLDLIDLKNPQSKEIIDQYMLMEQILEQICQKILINISLMQEEVYNSIDFYSYRNYPIKQHQFTKILCDDNYLSLLFPRSQPSSIQIIKNLISLWMKIKIELDSINRVETILQDEHLDKVTFLREIQSPRDKITQNIPWICFQMEMKTQIWLSQYQTFKLLSQNKSGIVTQLNMGEGKTQIIIPMIVLNQIYIKKDKIPRVNLLTPLYHQAQANYYKFLSVTGFKLPLFPIYFNRDVVMSPTHIKQIQYAVNLLHKHCLILVDRDSILSIILKIRQQNCRIKKQDDRQFSIYKSCKKDQWFFRDIKILDIFDEVDALMTAKKSFIYSIGNSSALPHNRMRFQYCTIILQVILKELIHYMLGNEIAVLQQSYENAQEKILKGHYPKGLRIINNTPASKIKQLRSKIFMQLMNKYLPPQFQFYKSFNQKEKQALKIYCIDQSSNSSIIQNFIEDNLRNQIYIVRGLLAYGVIEHCLSLRCGVDYGVPGVNSIKKVGVPYEAADVPSKRSEYSHPQVATILSYLSYYNRGLTVKQFQQALKCLIAQTKSSQYRNYKQWINSIQKQQCRPFSAKQANQINYQSAIQRDQLYSCFQFNRATINFWLTHCVFPTDLTQYTKSITSSSWDLAKSQNCIGFSGTKDTHWVFPQYLYLKNCGNDEINGTDGKMIQLMLENTHDVKQIKTSSDDLWMRFCQSSLQLSVGCIIDAGAILAGKQLQLQIVPWISNHPLFKKLNWKGISYCSQDGIWRVYDTTTNSIIPRDSNIPEHQTFVIFDEARTRGADMKMKMNTVAALSLGPNMTKDKLMQAVGRLRKFGRNQKIYILSSQEILSNIKGLLAIGKKNKRAKTIKVLQWVCSNSIRDNKKMLYPNSKLAWIHFQNIYSKIEVSIQQSDPSLSKMYEQVIQVKELIKVHQQMSQNFIQNFGVQQLLIYIHQNINQYGKNYAVKCHSYDDICQRQTQLVQQALKEAQNEHAALIALNKADFSEISEHSLTSIDIQLDERLTFTRNFLSCTDSKEDIKYKQDNELCKIHYVMIKPKHREMRVLTQRQANREMTEGIMFVGPDQLKKPQSQDFIVRFEDLSIHQICIQELSLERALTDAHFFNGSENFQNRNYIYDTIRHNKQRLRKYPIDRVICHFLERRRTIQQKYMCSHLQGIFKQMISSR